MNTYGFHTIHGRAPALATGIKVSNPDLSVWIVTGDGDGLSIGGNHLMHALRRNLDVKILLFNNEIYGLTKGQYSPTSQLGLRTKATPYGSIDRPFNPLSLALGAGATFVARTIDTQQKHMASIFAAAAKHRGTAFVEIFQNCVIFNDRVFDQVVDKSVRDERTVDLVPGQPIVYGDAHDKGLVFDGFSVKSVRASEAAIWDPSTASAAPALMMAEIGRTAGGLPTPVGIFRQTNAQIFEQDVHAQIKTVTEKKGRGRLADLVYAGDVWDVK
jgi:2-oxoglutarate ferredoxin oxidoreductase subunit beta